MRIVKLLTFCIIIFLPGCNQKNSSLFPEDLLYQSNPIHPVCITQTQEGDSSRFDPQKIYSIKDTDYISLYEGLDYKETKNITTFDPATNTVIAKRTYTIVGQPMKSYDEYQYIGSYNGKHIIKTKSYELSSKALVTRTLGLIERKENTIQNVGEIAYDAYGRGIKIHSLSKNIIQFSQKFTLDEAIDRICGEYCGPPIDFKVSLLFQVDLDSSLQNMEFESSLIGLIMPDTLSDLDSLSNSKNTKLLAIICSYIQEGRKKLDRQEAVVFAREIIAIFS